jgi:hypothetical protein
VIVVNFAHPITAAQKVRIAEMCAGTRAATGVADGTQVAVEVIDVPVQLDLQASLPPQVVALVDSVGLSPAEWQSERLIVNLPGYVPACAVLLAELHGRMGYFPSILHLRPVLGQATPVFEVAAIINLQEVREQARTRR